MSLFRAFSPVSRALHRTISAPRIFTTASPTLQPISLRKTFAAMTDASPPQDASTTVTPPEEPPLPKLTPAEFRAYNNMAEQMDYYHNHFRHTWSILYRACESNSRPSSLSIRQFLALAAQFCSQLTFHHTIEEQSIFPVLARKMPVFQKKKELLEQHRQIHEGLEKLEDYVEECRKGERELVLREMKGVLDGFGDTLWKHLDEEVKQLGAENMRRYWSVEEMKRMPM